MSGKSITHATVRGKAIEAASGFLNRPFVIAGWTLLGFVVFAIFLLSDLQMFQGQDGDIYMDATRGSWGGRSLYAYANDHGFGFTYPPFAAVVFSLLAWLPGHTPVVLLQILCWLAWYLVLYSVARLAGMSSRMAWAWAAMIAPLTLLWYPLIRSLGSGQVDALIAVMVVVDVALLRNTRASGLLIGLAMGVKLTPAAMMLYFFVLRRWSSLARVVIGFGLSVVVGFGAYSTDSALYWTELVWGTSRVGDQTAALNQSLSGLVTRVWGSPLGRLSGESAWWWLLLVVAVTFVAWRSMEFWRRQSDYVMVLATNVLLMVLISPVSWLHHWVVAIVPVAGLIIRGVALGNPTLWGTALAGILILSVPPWWYLGSYREEGGWNALEMVAGNAPVGWAMVVLFAPYVLMSQSRHR